MPPQPPQPIIVSQPSFSPTQPETPTFIYTQHDEPQDATVSPHTPVSPRFITAAQFSSPPKALQQQQQQQYPSRISSPAASLGTNTPVDFDSACSTCNPPTPRRVPSPPPQEGDVFTHSTAEIIAVGPSPTTPPSPPHMQCDPPKGDFDVNSTTILQAIPRAPSRPSRLFISSETNPSISSLASNNAVNSYSPLEVKFPWNRRSHVAVEEEEEGNGSIFPQKELHHPQPQSPRPSSLRFHHSAFPHEYDSTSPVDTISIPSSSRVPSPSSFNSASSDSHPHRHSSPDRTSTPPQFIFRKPEYDAHYHQTHFHHHNPHRDKHHSRVPILHELKRFFKTSDIAGPMHYNSEQPLHHNDLAEEPTEKDTRRHTMHAISGHGHSKSETYITSKPGPTTSTPQLSLTREVSLKPPPSPLRKGSFSLEPPAPSPSRTRSSGPIFNSRRAISRLKTASHSSLSTAYLSSAPSTTYGNTINSYDIHSRYGRWGKVLGKGAGGSVRIIRRTSGPDAGQMLAVKQFRPPHEAEPARDYIKKLTAEFCIGSTLHHHNVIKTLDLVKEHQSYFEVMEYAPNDLFALVQTGQLSQFEVLCFWRQALEGVTYLHTSGLAHRDLKLDNLVVTADGVLKIIDFGCSFVFRYPFSTEVDFATGVCGSDPYIAPEQHDHNKPYDPRLSDLWSLAIVYVCMCLRRFPWRIPRPEIDPSYRAYLEQACPSPNPENGEIPKPTAPGSRRLLKLLPRESRSTMARILEPNPNKRITLEELLEEPWVRDMGRCAPAIASDDSPDSEGERVHSTGKLHHHKHHLFVGEGEFSKVEMREEVPEGKRGRRHG